MRRINNNNDTPHGPTGTLTTHGDTTHVTNKVHTIHSQAVSHRYFRYHIPSRWDDVAPQSCLKRACHASPLIQQGLENNILEQTP